MSQRGRTLPPPRGLAEAGAMVLYALVASRQGDRLHWGVVDGTEPPERVILTYRHRSGPSGEREDVQEPVPLTWTACNFGGQRAWFVCPRAGCGRRVAVLYGPGSYFLCRHCYDLVYESQRENGMYRALHKAQSIRERLGGSASMMKPFPERGRRGCTMTLTGGSERNTTRPRWSS